MPANKKPHGTCEHKPVRKIEGLPARVSFVYDRTRFWRIKQEAIRRGVTATELLRGWIDERVDELPE